MERKDDVNHVSSRVISFSQSSQLLVQPRESRE